MVLRQVQVIVRIRYSFQSFFSRLISLLCLGWPLLLSGQSTREIGGWPPLQVLSVEKGLPQSFVSDVVPDDEGFMWVGTRDGLARYDGNHFVPFQHRSDDPTSPLDNVITKLWKGRTNEIWVQYETGDIDRLNTQTGHCWHLTQQPAFAQIKKLPFTLGNILRVDEHGNLWGILTNKGVFCCDFGRNKLLLFNRATHNLSSDTVKTISVDRHRRLWFITQRGISQFNKATNRFDNTAFPIPFVPPKGYNGLIVEKINSLLRSNGELFFADENHLFFLNPDTRALRAIPSSVIGQSDLQFMAHSPSGQDYVEAHGTVYQLTEQEQLVPIWHYQSAQGKELTGMWCTGMCFDQVGVLWMGGNTLGLLRIDLAAEPLRTYTYRTAFCQDVFQQELGLSLASQFHWSFTSEWSLSLSSYLLRTTTDQQGKLWIGLGDQVGYYDRPQQRVMLLPTIPSRMTAAFRGGLRGLSIATTDRLWIVTELGRLFWYDNRSGRWQPLPGNKTVPASVQASDLLADSTDLWVTTTEHGLLRFTVSGERYQTVQFGKSPAKQPIPTLLDLERDPTRPELMWIGSYQGLICFNKKTLRYQRFTTDHGLPNNTIYSIVPDQQGYLWLSTNKGLCRFHPIQHSTLNLRTEDGLLGDEFNRFHHLKLPDGRLAFGGLNGWVVFDPALIKGDKSQPAIVLTELKINNKPIDQYSIRSPLAAPVNKLSDLQLPYDQNYLTFEFATLHTHQPDRSAIRYQLVGYDNNWTVGTQSTAAYTKLPPGQYKLRVNAANGAGNWSPHIKELGIEILPPLWASGWAYGLYALLAGSALVGLVRFRTKQDRERHERMFHERQANELRQLDQTKTRFFSNVSHELRTPLTLMLGPLGTVLTNQHLTTRDERLIQTAYRNTQHLLSLVNELLDLTKLEAGKMDLQRHPVPLKPLITGLIANFDSQAQQKSITLTSDIQTADDPVIELDERKFRQVITNLLANALKFTSAGGTVHVTVQYVAPQLRVAVSDTGRGILPDDLPHIFDRYFQTKQADAPTEGGTGIGLALCQELIRLMQGNFWADSEWGKGSTFTLVIPAPESKAMHTDTPTIDAPPLTVSQADEHSLAINQSADAYRSVAFPQTKDTVLVVEDNADLRDYLTTILSPSLTVQTAENGQVALTLLANMSQLPALIISDIMMPVMDGFQLLETLKTHDTYRRIPIIMLTARAEQTDKLRALRIGVDDYLVKPFNEEELTARITTLLHNWRERTAILTPETAHQPEDDLVPAAFSSEDSDWLKRLESLTNDRLDQFNLTADELADELAMSRRTFYRTIKRLTGLTPAQYLTEARFRQARYLLEARQVSTVKQAAHQVGFRHVSHFAQTFQQRFGKHPDHYL